MNEGKKRFSERFFFCKMPRLGSKRYFFKTFFLVFFRMSKKNTTFAAL